MWLPNARRVNLGSNVSGGPYDDMRKPKVCWHMTQGSSLAGARSAFAAYPPHIGYNPATRELEQYVPLDRHSYAFFNSEADDEYIIQIEVVGFSESAHLMPDWQVQNIVTDLVDPLEVLVGVPPVVIWHGFRGAGEGIVLADPSSPIRISLSQLREFSGHLGHQHIPGDGHWDPGRFRIDEVLRRSQEEDDMPYSEGQIRGMVYAAMTDCLRDISDGTNVTGYRSVNRMMGDHVVGPVRSALSPLTDDEANIVAAVQAQQAVIDMSGEQLQALLSGLTAQTKAALKAALREGTGA